MLRDAPLHPVPGDLPRKWMSDDYFDLIVWYEPPGGGRIKGFQLCYDKAGAERALTWVEGRGYFHAAVDAGDDKPTANRTPLLVGGGVFPRDQVIGEFARRSAALGAEVRDLVARKLHEYPQA
jgi:hypothetical protein